MRMEKFIKPFPLTDITTHEMVLRYCWIITGLRKMACISNQSAAVLTSAIETSALSIKCTQNSFLLDMNAHTFLWLISREGKHEGTNHRVAKAAFLLLAFTFNQINRQFREH